MEAVETFEVNDKVVEIHIDEDPQHPRREMDNADLFICSHKRYDLGDKHDYRHENFNGWDDMEKQIIKDHDPVVIRRLYMYDHSGITIADKPFSCPWDSGMIGFALISRESALKEMGGKRITKRIKIWANTYLDGTIQTYDEYLRGAVYGYVIKDKDDNELESCYGFYGLDYVKEQARDVAEAIKVPEKEDPNQLKLAFA